MLFGRVEMERWPDRPLMKLKFCGRWDSVDAERCDAL